MSYFAYLHCLCYGSFFHSFLEMDTNCSLVVWITSLQHHTGVLCMPHNSVSCLLCTLTYYPVKACFPFLPPPVAAHSDEEERKGKPTAWVLKATGTREKILALHCYGRHILKRTDLEVWWISNHSETTLYFESPCQSDWTLHGAVRQTG